MYTKRNRDFNQTLKCKIICFKNTQVGLVIWKFYFLKYVYVILILVKIGQYVYKKIAKLLNSNDWQKLILKDRLICISWWCKQFNHNICCVSQLNDSLYRTTWIEAISAGCDCWPDIQKIKLLLDQLPLSQPWNHLFCYYIQSNISIYQYVLLSLICYISNDF